MKCPHCDREINLLDPVSHFTQCNADPTRLFNIGVINQDELDQINNLRNDKDIKIKRSTIDY